MTGSVASLRRRRGSARRLLCPIVDPVAGGEPLPVWIRRGLLLRRRRGAVRLQARRRGSRASAPVRALVLPARLCPRASSVRARLLPVPALCSAAGPSKLCAPALLCWCSAERKGGGALLCLVLCSGGALLCCSAPFWLVLPDQQACSTSSCCWCYHSATLVLHTKAENREGPLLLSLETAGHLLCY